MQVDIISNILSRPQFAAQLAGVTSIAVAVSGGPDSMALACGLAEWGAQNNAKIHALTVNHGLRENSAKEAEQVQKWLQEYPAIHHKTLQWRGPKPSASIQAEARKARYDLMADYCATSKITHLFLAHHQDDQAETMLFRLAKGSGLKGLSGMRPIYDYSAALKIIRPLLDVPKADLVVMCKDNEVPFVIDPSNDSIKFARVRLRQSADILAEEGLTPKRLATTAKRLARAEEALDQIATDIWTGAVAINTAQIVLKLDVMQGAHPEIALRLIIKSFSYLITNKDYLPRMKKLETLAQDICAKASFQTRTLGGLQFKRDDKHNKIIISIEERLVSAAK